MGAPGCCCCVSNNVRHLVLFLSALCLTVLFANVNLFGLTTVLHDEGDLSAGLRSVDSTANLHAKVDASIDKDGARRRREIPAIPPIVDDNKNTGAVLADTVLKTSTTEEKKVNPSVATTQTLSEKVDAHPIETHTIPEEVEETTKEAVTSTSTTKKASLVFFTNSPSTQRVITVKRSTSAVVATTTPTITTTSTSTETPVKESSAHTEPVTEHTEFVQKEPKEGRLQPTSVPLDLQMYLLRSLVFAAPGIGILIGTLPSTLLINKFGSRYVFSLALLLSAIVTVLMPFLLEYGFIPLFLLRLLTGLAMSVGLPFAGSMTANWGTLKEQLFFIAALYLFVPWAPIYSWNLSMFLFSNDVDVKFIYIAHAVITVIMSVSFLIFYRDRPQYHNWVNGIELNKIVAGKVQELKSNRILSNPHSTIIRSVSAWAVWVAMLGFFIVITVFSLFLPTFFSNMDVWLVDYLGLYGALPFILMPLFYILSTVANRSICCNSTMQVRVWNSISYGTTALMLVIMPVMFFAQEEGFGRNLLLALTLAPLGFVMAGALRSVTLVGRFYSQHILSYMGFSLGVAMTLTPFIVLWFVRTNALAEWLHVFLVCAAVLLITAVSFALFGRGRSAGWAEHSWDPNQTSKMRTLELIDIARDECGLYEMRLIGPGSK